MFIRPVINLLAHKHVIPPMLGAGGIGFSIQTYIRLSVRRNSECGVGRESSSNSFCPHQRSAKANPQSLSIRNLSLYE